MRRSLLATLFGIGVALHLLIWLANVGRLSSGALTCQESECFNLVVLDFPISLLFVAGSATLVTYGSALLGTLWWGVLAPVIGMWIARRRGKN